VLPDPVLGVFKGEERPVCGALDEDGIWTGAGLSAFRVENFFYGGGG